MAKFSGTQLILAASAAFIGGVLVSLFTSPKSGSENRKWVSENTDELQNWMETRGKDFKNKTFPDLFEATEDLGLTDDDLITGNN